MSETVPASDAGSGAETTSTPLLHSGTISMTQAQAARMKVFPCPNKVDCDDNPFRNLTSESEDRLEYLGRTWDYPPKVLGRYWEKMGCLGNCVSYVSQLEADLCAQAQAIFCGSGGGGGGEPLYYNDEVSCAAECPGGGTFTYVVPYGWVVGQSQEEAQERARTLACRLANENLVCFGQPQRCACIDVSYESTVQTSPPTAVSWRVVSGALPTGLALSTALPSTTVQILGTPTERGIFTFTLRGTAANGNYSEQVCVISILEITTTSLPDFTLNTPYSAQLEADGGWGPYVWTLVSGTLPTGLDLTSAGLISGTPTAANGSASLTFAVADSACETMEVALAKPRIAMSTTSSTRIQHWLGWEAFDGTTRRFKKLEWSGTSESRGTPLGLADEFFAARYTYDGYSQITAAGAQISRYKKLLTQRSTSPTPQRIGMWYVPEHEASSDMTVVNVPGYCWADDASSVGPCDGTYLTPAGDLSTNRTDDVSDLPMGNFYIQKDPDYVEFTNTNLGIELPIGRVWHWDGYRLGFYPEPIDGFPRTTTNSVYTSWAYFRTTNCYWGRLSEEYTDAEASANATVTAGIGDTASYTPRNLTSGTLEDRYRSTIVSVQFTLTCTRLVIGRSYRARVSFISSTGTVTYGTYLFTADAETHTITASVPTPSANHSTIVRYPKITML